VWSRVGMLARVGRLRQSEARQLRTEVRVLVDALLDATDELDRLKRSGSVGNHAALSQLVCCPAIFLTFVCAVGLRLSCVRWASALTDWLACRDFTLCGMGVSALIVPPTAAGGYQPLAFMLTGSFHRPLQCCLSSKNRRACNPATLQPCNPATLQPCWVMTTGRHRQRGWPR
jgi:hypothetical protein